MEMFGSEGAVATFRNPQVGKHQEGEDGPSCHTAYLIIVGA